MKVIKQEKKAPRFSFSKINVYSDCGFRYWLVYEEGHYIDQETVATLFGTLVHYIYEQIGQDLILGVKPDYEKLKRDFLDINIPKKSPTDKEGGVYGVRIIEQKYYDEFHDFDEKSQSSYCSRANEFYNSGIYKLEEYLSAHPNLQIKAVEQYFSIEHQGRVFSGYIDRILYDTDTHEYVIEDIKTKTKIYEGHDLAQASQQFIIYAMAVQSIYGLTGYPMRFNYELPFVKDARQPVGTYDTFVKKGIETLDATLAKIDAKIFVPHPSPLCHWCPFCGTVENQPEEAKGLCPYYSLWTPGGDRKVYETLNRWQGMEKHEAVMLKYVGKQLPHEHEEHEYDDFEVVVKGE